MPWLVVMLMVSINALYVATEFALVAAPRSKIAARARAGSLRAAELMDLLHDGVALDRAIAACQVGITLASLLVGAFGQATIGVSLASMLTDAGLAPEVAISAAAITVLVVLTVLQVVLGELVPKSLALQFPLEVALFVVVPVRLSTTLFRPLISVLNGSALLLLRPFGIEPGGHQHVHTTGEIELLLGESKRGGALSPEAHRQLQRGLSLSQRTARQLMVPRGDMLAIEVSTPIDEVLRQLLASPYSRLPVYEDTLDSIIGTVSAKEFTGLYARQQPIPPLRQMLRRIPFVPDLLTGDRIIRHALGYDIARAGQRLRRRGNATGRLVVVIQYKSMANPPRRLFLKVRPRQLGPYHFRQRLQSLLLRNRSPSPLLRTKGRIQIFQSRQRLRRLNLRRQVSR
jgi:CBS domain containing-hemolysin-like protein